MLRIFEKKHTKIFPTQRDWPVRNKPFLPFCLFFLFANAKNRRKKRRPDVFQKPLRPHKMAIFATQQQQMASNFDSEGYVQIWLGRKMCLSNMDFTTKHGKRK